MANRIDSLLSGVGSVFAVESALLQAEDSEHVRKILKYKFDVIRSLVNPDGRIDPRFLAVIAATLNTSYEKNGDLYSVKDGTRLWHQYHMSGAERTLLASLMSD